MIKEIKYRIPVKCQNGHETYWYCETDGLGHIKNIGVPKEDKCDCPKWDMEQGYTRTGNPEILESPHDIQDGDLCVGSIFARIKIDSDEYEKGLLGLKELLIPYNLNPDDVEKLADILKGMTETKVG